MSSKNSIVDRTMNDTSTMWGIFTGFFGSMTISEWCLIITAVVTIFNFAKNWYIDMRKLQMLEEEHNFKLKYKVGLDEDENH